jgi:hypothetical protein
MAAVIVYGAANIADGHTADMKLDSMKLSAFDPTALRAIIEGTIEAGDFEKFREFYFKTGRIEEVFLASPGGSLVEAMKIGRFVRQLKLATMIPSRVNKELHDLILRETNIKQSNLMCASACFFVFVGGVTRIADDPILGIHRPFLPEKDLKTMTGDQAIEAGTLTRAIVENYLKEMDVPIKYGEQMFAIAKDKIKWISRDEFEADFDGHIPELRDWLEAKCNNFTDIEKLAWKSLKERYPSSRTPSEEKLHNILSKKLDEQLICRLKTLRELRIQAYTDVLSSYYKDIRR